MSFNDVLTRFNLQRRRTGLARLGVPAFALAGAAVVGWIVGLLFAPTTGRVQRRRLRQRLTASRADALEVAGKARALAGL